MKTRYCFKAVSWILLVLFPVCVTVPAYAQSFDTENNSFDDDPFGEIAPVDDLPLPSVSDPAVESAPEVTSENSSEPEYSQPVYSEPVVQAAPVSQSNFSESHAQNAIIEGVQITSEPGDQPDEKIISCYFIFRDKPSSYFYEAKQREKKLIFEFNDTRTGESPVPSTSESPIKGFTIEQRQVDVNKEVRGLKPEWHDVVRVEFELSAMPEVHVSDEYSIISFSFKWTSNPEKVAQYSIKDKNPAVMLWSTSGLVGVGLGILSWYLWIREPPPPPPLGPIDISDLPDRPSMH